MGLKEDYEKRKQRREAVEYFRKNNSAFLSPKQYAIVIVAVLLISLVSGFIQAAITTGTSIRFGVVYLLTAYLIAWTANKTTSFVNDKVKIICYIGYIIAIISTPIFTSAIYLGLQYLPTLLFNINMWISALTSILQPDLFGWLFYLLGAYELTMLLK